MLLSSALVVLGAAPGQSAPLTFDLSGGGLSVRAGDRVLVTTSRLVAVEPPWVKHRFYSRQAHLERQQQGSGAEARITLSSDDARYPFKLKEYSAAATPEGLRMTVGGGLEEALPTAVEYTALVIPGNLLAGAQYEATLPDGGTARGRIGALPGATSALVPAFRAVVLRTPFGTLRLSVEEGSPLGLTDRRAEVFEDQRCFWVGCGGVAVTPEAPFRHVLTLSFDAEARLPGPTPLPRLGTAPAPMKVEDLKRPEEQLLPLLPPPQERTEGTGAYRPQPGDRLWVAAGRGADANRRRAAARRIVIERMGLPLRVAASGARPRRGVSVQVVGAGGGLPAGARVPEQAEGYWLRVDESGVRIVGRDARGAFYGLQTLRFLLRRGEVPATEIRDWPDYRLRGLHLLADDASLQFHGRLIEELMAPLKLNHIILECEYAKWDATRPLHQPWGASKDDLRALVQLAAEQFIEVTPLVQTLGHCEWLFQNGQNLEWAEDPETPYAYDVSNPAVYALLEKMLDEVFAVFRPRFLHIGHDEVDMRGRYPHRPANVAKGAQQCVLEDILWFHRYARRRGARVMMWHDMVTTREEGTVAFGGPPLNLAQIRPKLPKDIILVDWQYTPQETYPEVPILRGEGFEVIGATWNAPGNIERFAAYGRDQDLLGMIETTWTGYRGNRTALQEHFAQIAAYVRAGDWFWNAGAAARPAYHDGEMLTRLLPASGESGFGRVDQGTLLDLTPWSNVALSAGSDPFGLGDALGLEALPVGARRFGAARFLVGQREGVPAGVTVRSALAPAFPEAVTGIAVGAKTAGLLVLHTTPAPAASGEEIGRYRVRYADGSEATVPVRYGREIGYPGEAANYYLSAPAYSWEHGGRTLHLWALEWRNPHPEKVIETLELHSGGAAAAPVLLAVSLVQQPGG
ncbi:MAG: family 20 glycosylhydrolase [Armatimonadetes bacterium]|nr:family 20 glycosylhydrolase [Armatimonadota bacterium]